MVEFRKVIKKDTAAVLVIPADRAEVPAESASEYMTKHPEPDRSSQDFFLEGLALGAAALEWAAREAPGEFPLRLPFENFIGGLLEFLNSADAWKLLSMTRACSEPSYLPSHLMNVCITTSWLAMRMGFGRRQLQWLATAAFLHDVGMARVPRVWDSPNTLSEDEKAAIAPHPIESLKMIELVGCCGDPSLALAAAEHHERADGSGYPNRKNSAELSPASHILAVADVFTAMTNPRPYRGAMAPFDAVRALSHLAGRSLHTETVRRFLQIMSIYPIGSFARLNNGMVVRVIGGNETQLTRPVVQVISGTSGEPVEGSQVIDLKKEKLLFIREPLNLPALDPVFKIG